MSNRRSFGTSTTEGFYFSRQASAIETDTSLNAADKQFAPTFLFGNRPQKRRSLALNAAGTNLSPAGILRSREEAQLGTSPGAKSVHWSPALVRTRTISSHDAMQSPLETEPTDFPSPEIVLDGPPRRSLVAKEPPTKMSKLDEEGTRGLNLSSISSSVSVFDSTASNSVYGGRVSEDLANGQSGKDFWLTIFGFPKEKVQDVLNLFARHGNIVAHKLPDNGNWAHIRYSSSVHVKQALSRNAQVFNGYMIGVVPCTDKELAEHDGTNARLNVNTILISSKTNGLADTTTAATVIDNSFVTTMATRQIPSVSNSSTSENSFNHSRLTSSMRAGMRPLNASLISDNLNISLENPNNKKPDTLMGKLWNFVSQT